MDTHQDYPSLVRMHKDGSKLIKNLRISSLAIQGGILGFVTAWKHLQIDHYKLAAPMLFSLALFFTIKDFLPLRRIDANMTRIILEGLTLEKKNRSYGNFFYDVLKNFNVLWTMIQRSIVDIAVIWVVGFQVVQLITDVKPDFTINTGWLYPLAGLLGYILSDLYYRPLKPLVNAKREVLAT